MTMTAEQIYPLVLVSLIFLIYAVREAKRNLPLSALLVAIPLASWLAIWFGK
jgi:hypothetical protein